MANIDDPGKLPKLVISRDKNYQYDYRAFITSPKSLSFIYMLDKARISVGQTNLSYRVINHWESLGLLPKTKSRAEKWRKFGIWELFWLYIISELRDFGFPNNKILRVKRSLFNSKVKGLDRSLKLTYNIKRALWDKKDCFLIVLSDGQADIATQEELEQSDLIYGVKSCIKINFNYLLKRVFLNLKLNDEVKSRQNEDLMMDIKELNLLSDIRSGDFDAIAIKLKNGKIERLEKTKNFGAVENSYEKVREIIKMGVYQEIILQTENGKTVNVKSVIKEK